VFQGPAIGRDQAYTFSEVRTWLASHGAQRSDRVYLVFVDHIAGAYALSGQGDVASDDRPGPGNANNTGPAYGMVNGEARAWNWKQLWFDALHELGHALGAVQCSAPHSSCPKGELGHHHCYEEFDVMCYDDGGSYFTGRDGVAGTSDDRAPRVTCRSNTPAGDQWDCGKDDYFNVEPAPGSYLDTHWNVARSRFATALRTELGAFPATLRL
jgi:hypothetical protein